MKAKPRKILIVSDSFRLHTGFANVGRHVADHFYYHARNPDGTSKYTIVYLGWYDNPKAPEKRPYKLYQTARDETGRPIVDDKWGQQSLGKIVEEERPDIVIGIGDTWMVEHIKDTANRKSFKFVFYMPVDGSPTPEIMMADQNKKVEWKKVATDADHVIAFSPFGMRSINRMMKANKCTTHIPHGVESKIFKPLKHEEKFEVRKSHFPMLPEEAFLIGFFSRNQPRKAIDKLIHAVSIFQNQHETPDRPVYLYMHCAFDDKVGWNIPALAQHFGLKPDRMLQDKALQVGAGINQEALSARYNCCDIMALPTRGEGWGLTILESMSCGVPVLTSNYSAHPDYCRPGSLFIKTATMISEPITNIRRCIVSVSDFVIKIGKMYNNTNNIMDRLSKGGRRQAETYDWALVGDKWEAFIDTVDTSDLKAVHRVSAQEILQVTKL